ncbi:MAG: Ribonuclease J [Chroococcopsis gigantea SAG 12.99]|jgi:Cft2 family RNA processing exonuclease|nr:MBL fold metallo-hydrolase [Chlorogloea purpurea SAG 13.99]MDV3000337.1 Ribonuclease J [Chroococcopsis gigantea SAG 12.99]
MKIIWYLSGSVRERLLTTDTGIDFKIKGNTLDIDGSGNWQCIPVTDSDGRVICIKDVEKIEPSPANRSGAQRAFGIAMGRVLQYSKKGLVVLKFSNTTKITFRTELEFKVGAQYNLSFQYRDGGLHVTKAERCDGDERSLSIAPIDTTIAGKYHDPWRDKLESSILDTYPGIQLDGFSTRGTRLEWSGILADRRIRIGGRRGRTELEYHEFHRGSPVAPLSLEEPRLEVIPLGAARSIGASCFLVRIGDYEIVLDAGIRMGANPLPDLGHLENPDLILITHAHQDHIGALPVLHSMFQATPMITTPATREIADVMLRDFLNVQEKREGGVSLFDGDDLENTIFCLETEMPGVEFSPLPGLTVKFINAGHIVGAVCIYLRLGDRSLLYTGDYNIANSRTTNGLKLTELPRADMLITEATYGTSSHPARKEQESGLIKSVLEVIDGGGNVLIPAFALGRAQEILLALRTNPRFLDGSVPIYVDGLVRSITDVFADNLDWLPESVKNLMLNSKIPPFFDGKTIIPIECSADRPLAMAKPSVIVASSGMLTGGASVYYAKTLLERDNAAVFISGYTDEESPGRLLQDIKSGEDIEIDGETITVKAMIRKFNLSAHTDRPGIGQVINRVAPRHLILVHGTPRGLRDLAETEDLKKNYIIHVPHTGDSIEFGVMPEYINRSRNIELTFPNEIELELETDTSGTWIKIPRDMSNGDPRWEKLLQDGSISGKWNHDSLVLLPSSSYSVKASKAARSNVNCCAKCEFFLERRCDSPSSYLYGQIVDPWGCCTEFIATENAPTS